MNKLSFCRLQVINRDIIEVIFNDNVELTSEMFDEFLGFTSSEMNKHFSILLNKSTKYSYKFDTLLRLSESSEVRCIGVVTYDAISAANSEYMKHSFNKSGKKIEIFRVREDALNWLVKTVS